MLVYNRFSWMFLSWQAPGSE